jgi:hypothetical protein
MDIALNCVVDVPLAVVISVISAFIALRDFVKYCFKPVRLTVILTHLLYTISVILIGILGIPLFPAFNVMFVLLSADHQPFFFRCSLMAHDTYIPKDFEFHNEKFRQSSLRRETTPC